jgi:single-strand DNA-binding protein
MAGLRLARINRVQLSGRVTRDLTLRYAPDGTAVVTFQVAFNRWVKAGEAWRQVPGFIGVLATGRLAERCAERLRKGSALYVEGRLQERRFAAQDGGARSLIEIRADEVQFLERESEGEGEAGDDRSHEGRRGSARADQETGELFPEGGPEDEGESGELFTAGGPDEESL